MEDQRRNAERLEAGIAERALALADAHACAQKDAAGRSEFLAAMTEQIRMPLEGIAQSTSLIAEGGLNPKQRHHVETIRSSSDALLHLANDILDFSRIEAGNMEIQESEFDLDSALEDAIESVTASAGARDITITPHLADDVPFQIVSDAAKLRRVLQNLLSTAVRLTGMGSVLISVTTEGQAESNGFTNLHFRVEDMGVGLALEKLAGLFQPFSTADTSVSRPTGGTGLGLTIAKRLAELMGGSMGISSDPGGSTFWFSLPAKIVPQSLPVHLETLSGKRVLLLQGARDQSNIIKRHLKRAGMRVVTALETEPVSVIVADTAYVQETQSLSELGHAPILVLGAPSDFSHLRSSLPRDAVYLPKPTRCLDLLSAVQRLLENENVAASEEPIQRHDLRDAEILLVEDNQVNQLITRLFLAKIGCRVTLANNGQEACSAVDYRSYDLILMDCEMPTMDGFEATRLIRAREAGKHERTPIIALSTGIVRDERDRCYAAGMDDFLSKPIEKRNLESALTTWLTEKKIGAPVSR